ncbi:hypothetical protein ES703_84838 [subsurface metagenome]
MISVSDWFKTWMEKQTLNLLRKFTYDDIHESERVESFGSINRASDAIVSGGTSLVLINTDKHWNKFISDKTNLRRTAKLQLGIGVKNTIARCGIARSGITACNLVSLAPGSVISSGIFVPRGGEWLDILTGWGDDPQFPEAIVNLSIRDKLAGLLEKELGSEEVPLDYFSSSYNPADLTWAILTTHGGLDSTTSTANTDIDYTTWLAWKAACATANLSLEARFTGQSIREALELIRDLTNSDIYEAGNGKIKFFRFTLGTPPAETYLFDTDKFNAFSVKIDSGKIINYLRVYYDYDPDAETWTGNYLLEDSASQQPPPDGYGLCSETVDGTVVWHATLASATSYASRRIQVYKDPLETISLTSFMMGMITEVGDTVRITNAFFGYTGDPFWRVFKIINLNLAAGTISFEIANFQDVSEYSYTTPSVHDKSSETENKIENTSQNAFWGLASDANLRAGQKITLTGETLQQVSFWVDKVGYPTGTAYARIRKVSDDSIIETSSTTLDVSTLTTSPTWKDFLFTCAPNEEVRISLEFSGGGGSDYIRIYGLYYEDVISGYFTRYTVGPWTDMTDVDTTIKIQFPGYLAANTIDDDSATFWLPYPPNEAGAWISWDMGSVKYSKGCKIYWGSEAAYRPSEYKIWVSENGTDWTEVIHETDAPPASAWKTYSWDVQQIRYFKLSITTHGASGTKVYETDEYSIS